MKTKFVTIRDEHELWLNKNAIRLSKYIQNKIDADMTKDFPLPTLEDDITNEQRRKLENAKRLIAEEDAELSRDIDFENAEKQKKK